MQKPVLQPASILLPKNETDLTRWAVLACDQFTSQPEYWQQVDALVGDAPSTLRIVLPEVYLEDKDVPERIADIHAKMRQYLQDTMAEPLQGYVYVEREMQNGAVRQGLVGCVDLEDYSYEKGTSPRIRPSENTVVDRIPPRLAVRRGAPLESPHILMLADDPDGQIIESISAQKDDLPLLYDLELMLGGGRIRGWAVTGAQPVAALQAAMAQLDDAQRFAAMYGTQDVFALAVGDGNHSLATAKAYWEELKQTLPKVAQEGHPARYCLVELENVQSPAIEIEPIHRVLFGADPASLLTAAARYASAAGAQLVPQRQGQQTFTAITSGGTEVIAVDTPPHPLAVGTLENFLAEYLTHHPNVRVDYVHGEDAVRQLAKEGAVGILLPPVEKSDLFRGVALGGVLPKKTFSMGHAEEKRYYFECRKIEEQRREYLMFADERFVALQERFEQIQGQYQELIDETRNTAAQTVVSKGCLYNVLPFEREQAGDKIKGKILPEAIIHNDCYIYRLDEQGRVVLTERMSEFLKRPAYFTIYTYGEAVIERVYGDNNGLYRVDWAYLQKGAVTEILGWAKKSSSIEILDYQQSTLTGIARSMKSHKEGAESNLDLLFHYDNKGVLSAIHRRWPTGRTETIYSTAKVNFKAIGQRLLGDVERALSAFLQEHKGEHFTRFALDGYAGHGYVSLCIDTGLDEKFKDSPADWAYCDFASLPLVECPLDDNQTEKLRKTVAQVGMDLWKVECLQPLIKDNTFAIYVFDHNELIGQTPPC